mgnify:CR=1 FL=1
MGTKLYVGNLSYETQEFDLREHFAQFGEVVSANIITDRDSGRSRGFGFVEMADQEGATRAQQESDGHELDGRQLKVNEAKPRDDNRGGGGGRRGRW